ncbi:sigma-70 family RNA polymerase sigma factor [Rhodohalobacter sp. SW132]|uniref:RNA polymerase sigma factor n=1 Tax=Rhodohalobacter sp. SW132 TaxID=2293433 RepID=UPI000E257A1B|nr:sigma-70 family RNA polymerase sigma factor [Rhodohalobacter sp. SW132]REL24655.1 sigma-70 family RNA polymerase sigma factor [Rhodohalobacter sp. SW132]
MSKNNFLEDINLWKRVIHDDSCDAFSALFRKYYKPLLNYGLRLVPRKQLVKDSIQELFFTIWDKRERLSEIGNVRSYLYTSFRRTLFRQVEILQTWQKRDELYFSETPNEDLLNTEQLLITEEMNRETKENLQKAFDNLNGHQKEVAFLKFYSGLSNDEIGEIMGVKIESVYNYMYRAISTLKENLEVSLTG